MNHTPGPWKVYKKPGKNLFDEAVELSIVDKKGYEVALCPFCCHSPKWHEKNSDKHWGSDPKSNIERTPEEVVGNAQIIAAAPELYEACKRALEALEFYLADEDALDVRKELRAVIAKAEGKQKTA